ncbi:MAG: hypothetical protein QM608_14515 [Caulobacter sp.]
MRPFAIGLTAALAVAVLAPAAAFAAPKETKPAAAVDAKSREAGMKEAPPLVAQSGVACQVADARLIGADKKSNTSYYEVSCQEGMGYALVAKKDTAPQAFTCLETAAVGADGKESGLKCLLPANADPKQGLKPYLAKAGAVCDLENARAIGTGNNNSFFEVACKGAAGYVVQIPVPMKLEGTVANSCLLYDETGNISCKLTDRATQLQVVDTLNGAANNGCAVKDKRYILSTKTDNYFEVSCQDGKGYVLQQTASSGALARAIDCANAPGGAECTLTDSRAAKTEQAGLYTSLAKKAGFDCKVESYGLFPSNDPKKEVVELKCSNRPDGGIGVFSPTENRVYDCVSSEMNGYRCSYTKQDVVFPRLWADLKSYGKGSCEVSGARIIGRTETNGFVEVACADGLPGWVLAYPLNQSTPKPSELLSCLQAKDVGGGCKLPTNVKK